MIVCWPLDRKLMTAHLQAAHCLRHAPRVQHPARPATWQLISKIVSAAISQLCTHSTGPDAVVFELFMANTHSHAHTHMRKRVVFRMNYTQTHSRIHSKLCVTIIVCIQQLIRIKSFALRLRLFLGLVVFQLEKDLVGLSFYFHNGNLFGIKTAQFSG